MRILIGLIEHIGDIIACEPVARYLKFNHPEAHVSWAVSPAYRELVDLNPFIDETIELECLTEWITLRTHGKYDKIIDLHVNYRVCPHCRIPLVKPDGNGFVTAFDWLDFGNLLEAFSLGAGLPRLNAQPFVYLGEEHVEAVDGLGLSDGYCVIHRVSNQVYKDWSDAGWRELVSFLRETLGYPIVEVGAGKPDDLPAPLPGTVNLVNRLPLLQTGEVIRRANLFVGVDSGPAHFANAFRVPGVVLLGRILSFRTYNPFAGFYGSDTPLVKHMRHPTGEVRDLTAAEVIEAVSYVTTTARQTSRTRASIKPATVPRWREARHPDSQLLLASGLFDIGWFVLQDPAAADDPRHPVDRYLSESDTFSVSPGPLFDSAAYLQKNPGVADANVNVLLHFLRHDPEVGSYLQKMLGQQAAGAVKMGRSDPAFHPAHRAARPPLSTPDPAMPRLFAFYLPQFHPIPENDWAHGSGFTEWQNVVKAKPLFRGHHQPRLPGELGYYDLRAPDVIRQQIKLAQEHGISGFCFYYYYFAGRKILYKPIEIFLQSDIDFPFMFLWANENWTKRWDGGNDDVIIAQSHSPDDDLMFIRGLLPVFSDRRYVRVAGKPVLMVYKTHLFPDIKKTTELWRDEMEQQGFAGIYLVMVDDWTGDLDHPREHGFDASYVIPSNIVPNETLAAETDELGLDEDFQGRIVDYSKFAHYHNTRPKPPYRRFQTVMAPWDNTPRYGQRAMVQINGVGPSYGQWLLNAMLTTFRNNPVEERIVFLHSWNEWCEGTYVEPDQKNGRFFLEETRDTVAAARRLLTGDIDSRPEVVLATLARLLQDVEYESEQVLRASRKENRQLWQDLLRERHERHEAREEASRLRVSLDQVYASSSWRISAPLRRAVTLLRGR